MLENSSFSSIYPSDPTKYGKPSQRQMTPFLGEIISVLAFYSKSDDIVF